MSIIHTYLIKAVLKFFAIIQVMVISLFIIVDYLENVDKFIEADLSVLRAFFFVLLKVPFMIGLLTPVSMILAVLIALGLMNKNNEIIALKSSGISVAYMLKPILILGGTMTLILFLLSESIVPITMERANRIKQFEVKKKGFVTSGGKNIWLKGDRMMIHIKYYNPAIKTLFGVTLQFFDDQFQLIRRIDAQKGVYEEGGWVLYDVLELIFKRSEDAPLTYLNKFHERFKETSLTLLPDDLNQVRKKSEEMNILELWAYIQKVEKEGYDATINRIDFHSKIAFPFVCVIMSLMGTGIAIRRRFRGQLAMTIAIGIVLAFFFWVGHGFSISLGYAEILPPLVAAWLPIGVYLGIAWLPLVHAD